MVLGLEGSLYILSMASKRMVIISQYLEPEYFFRYNSLIVLTASIIFFLLFTKVTIRNKTMNRIITFLAPLTLGVYLIHDNQFLRQIIWNDIVDINVADEGGLLLIKAIIVPPVIFICSAVIEYFRRIVFKKFNVTI